MFQKPSHFLGLVFLLILPLVLYESKKRDDGLKYGTYCYEKSSSIDLSCRSEGCVSPHREGDQLVGFRLYAMCANGPLTSRGAKNGDIVLAVDTIRARGSADDGEKLLERLWTMRKGTGGGTLALLHADKTAATIQVPKPR